MIWIASCFSYCCVHFLLLSIFLQLTPSIVTCTYFVPNFVVRCAEFFPFYFPFPIHLLWFSLSTPSSPHRFASIAVFFSTIRCLLHYTCLFYVIVWCPKKVSFFYLFVPSVLERYSLLHKSLLRSHAELLHLFQLKAHHQQLIPIISAYSWIFPSLFVHVSNSNPVK